MKNVIFGLYAFLLSRVQPTRHLIEAIEIK
jgi:hypothetical protein